MVRDRRKVASSERRVITILFSDVTGSTAMAEQLDPEEWAEIMDEAFDYLIAPIRRYGGTVARLMGDAIMAFFGAPVAHEDDPQRAVLAGLAILDGIQPFQDEILEEYGLDFNIRVGINTGPVVVGVIGAGEDVEYTAMGDAVNLASRMEATAQPGSVQISEHTYRLVAPLFDAETLGTVDIKGRAEPVKTYRVIGRKTQPGRLRGIPGLQAPLIGREKELRELREAFDSLRGSGRGRIVTLVGEAGLGKSRLIQELRAGKEDLQSEIFWLTCHGISYDATRPYTLFRQMLRQSCGLSEEDSTELVQQKVQQFVSEIAPAGLVGSENGDGMDPGLYTVEVLLSIESESGGLALEGEAFKRQLFETVENIFRISARDASVVLACDDLHWADPASVELLIHLCQLVEEAPILFLLAARPERDAPGWEVFEVARKEYTGLLTPISLTPLGPKEGDSLVMNLLTISDLPESVREAITRKAEGNPFFMEELIRELIAGGALARDKSGTRWHLTVEIDSLTVPDSVQSLLVSRVDRLENDVRRTLQMASVIGRSFYFRVLDLVSDHLSSLENHLDTLQRVDLILEAAPPPELEYIFRHDLTREATYRSILHRERRRFHRQVGEALEVLFPNRLEEEAHRLAYHFYEAGDNERAIKYYTMAGDSSARLYANTEAISHYERALAIAREIKSGLEQLVYLYSQLGRTLEISGRYDEALSRYQEQKSLGQERDQPSLELASLVNQASVYATPTVKMDHRKGRALALEALSLAEALGDHLAEARALWDLMLVENYAEEDPHLAVTFGERSLAIARKHDLREQLAYTLHDLARAYLDAGLVDKAWEAHNEAQKLWRELGNLPMLADGLGNLAQYFHFTGQMDRALLAAREGLDVSRRIGSLWGQAYNLSILGPICLEQGEISQGIQAMEESEALAEEANFAGPRYTVPLILAWIYASLGAYETSLSYLGQLEELPDEFGRFAPIWSIFRRYLYNRMDEAEEGESEETLKTFPEMKVEGVLDEFNVYYGPLVIDLIANLAFSKGQFEEALAILDKGIDAMNRAGSRFFWQDITGFKANVLFELGQKEKAYNLFQEAYTEARRQGSRRSLSPILHNLARLEFERGNSEAAEEYTRQAEENTSILARNIEDTDLRAVFLALSLNQDILNRS